MNNFQWENNRFGKHDKLIKYIVISYNAESLICRYISMHHIYDQLFIKFIEYEKNMFF